MLDASFLAQFKYAVKPETRPPGLGRKTSSPS